jgi:hypothetical protein
VCLRIKYPLNSTGNKRMQIIAKCPQCNYTWKLDGCAADRRINCLKCGRLFKVPKLDDIPKAKTVIKQAKGDVYVDETGKTFG